MTGEDKKPIIVIDDIEYTEDQLTDEAKGCWTQLPDVPEAIRSAWATYRQALRDIPQQAGFPDTVTWPTKPA